MTANKKEFSDLDAATKDLADKVNQMNTIGGTYIQLISSMQASITTIQVKYDALQLKYNDTSDSIQPQINSLKNSSTVLNQLFVRMTQAVPSKTQTAAPDSPN